MLWHTAKTDWTRILKMSKHAHSYVYTNYQENIILLWTIGDLSKQESKHEKY